MAGGQRCQNVTAIVHDYDSTGAQLLPRDDCDGYGHATYFLAALRRRLLQLAPPVQLGLGHRGQGRN